MSERMGAFTLRDGDIWETAYCAGVWGTPDAVGSQYARRTVRGIEGSTVLYEDRAGELRRVSVGLFESWIRSQAARVVGQSAPRRSVEAPATPKPPVAVPKGQMLSIAQAAAEAGVTPTTIYYYVKKGALTVVGAGRSRRIPRDAWERFRKEWR